eukprot:COSAG05_NODE_579_length_8556_cov_44.773679_13_plen_32_part_00
MLLTLLPRRIVRYRTGAASTAAAQEDEHNHA